MSAEVVSKRRARNYIGAGRVLNDLFLGELETQIMDIIWELGRPVTPPEIFEIMYPKRKIAYITVAAAMKKLAKKGLLDQDTENRPKKTSPFVYAAKFSREQVAASVLDDVSKKLLKKPIGEVTPEAVAPERSARMSDLFLGELETQIMDIIWELGRPVTPPEIFEIMYPKRKIAYITVAAAMKKLAKKGLLDQDTENRPKKTSPFVYAAKFSREQVAASVLDDVSKKLLKKPIGEFLSSK